jgi:hypothetical protein
MTQHCFASLFRGACQDAARRLGARQSRFALLGPDAPETVADPNLAAKHNDRFEALEVPIGARK